MLEAPHGARLRGLPAVDIARGARLTLRIGRDADLGRDLVVDLLAGGGGTIEVGDAVVFGRGARLQPRGGSIRIGARTQVRDGAQLKADGDIVIGTDVLVAAGTAIHCTERVDVGDHAALADRVTVIDSDHAVDGGDTPYTRQPLRTEPVVVGRNVVVSANATVLRGARIGANSVVAAGAVVRGGEWPGGHLIGGVPARVLKALPEVPSLSAGQRLPRR